MFTRLMCPNLLAFARCWQFQVRRKSHLWKEARAIPCGRDPTSNESRVGERPSRAQSDSRSRSSGSTFRQRRGPTFKELYRGGLPSGKPDEQHRAKRRDSGRRADGPGRLRRRPRQMTVAIRQLFRPHPRSSPQELCQAAQRDAEVGGGAGAVAAGGLEGAADARGGASRAPRRGGGTPPRCAGPRRAQPPRRGGRGPRRPGAPRRAAPPSSGGDRGRPAWRGSPPPPSSSPRRPSRRCRTRSTGGPEAPGRRRRPPRGRRSRRRRGA